MDNLHQLRVDLLSDFFLFNQFIFKERTGREFIISKPVNNESHFVTVCRALEDVFYGRIKRLLMNIPPGWAKSELIKNFICWAYAHYADCNNLYISFAHELAASHTATIKQTIQLPIYRKLFGIEITRESSAKDYFKTTYGGTVAAFGSGGPITGQNAGLPGLDRFSGGVFIDDIHKPDEVHSTKMRDKIKRNYIETIEPRLRGINVPIVIIGQRLHQDDLFSYFFNSGDGQEWNKVVIKGLDEAGNARYPEVMPREKLEKMRIYQNYKFASQYQQDPVPAGGALFKEESFIELEVMPNILATFITADSAETEKTWNDKNAFSFWGFYQVKFGNTPVPDLFALHWLDCKEFQCEPDRLEEEFLEFWVDCMKFPVKPQLAIIEKKSTGVTLVSSLKKIPGLKIIALERNSDAGSKTQRFIDSQQYISRKQVTLPLHGKHTKMCIKHMSEITANDTHKFDDIADTCVDAINAAFVDGIIKFQVAAKTDYNSLASQMSQGLRRVEQLRKIAHGKGG